MGRKSQVIILLLAMGLSSCAHGKTEATCSKIVPGDAQICLLKTGDTYNVVGVGLAPKSSVEAKGIGTSGAVEELKVDDKGQLPERNEIAPNLTAFMHASGVSLQAIANSADVTVTVCFTTSEVVNGKVTSC